MKRFLLFISALFICNIAIADDITINWDINNQTYTTTTCEIGNDVLLPTTPTKRGHIFRGWVAEHFDRGTFANWDVVPSSVNKYFIDKYNNNIPKTGDYILVNDASGYVSIDDLKLPLIVTDMDNMGVSYNISGQSYKKNRSSGQTVRFGPGNEIGYNTIDTGRNGTAIYFYDTVKFNNVIYYNGQAININNINNGFTVENLPLVFYLKENNSVLSGTWKFVYDGVWATDGKNGWKPAEQIVSE